MSGRDWQLVMDTARKVWALGNDGFEVGDEVLIKDHMAKLLAAAERNDADPESES